VTVTKTDPVPIPIPIPIPIVIIGPPGKDVVPTAGMTAIIERQLETNDEWGISVSTFSLP
jgi:hypothetical protein